MAETSTSSDRPAGVTCDKYVRAQGKRCRHYLANGGCSLSGELMCVEWLKVNGHRQSAASEPERDLFGSPLHEKPAKKPVVPPADAATDSRTTEAAPAEPAQAAPQPRERLRGLTTEDIDSFRALGVEVCFHADDIGDVWLVPAHTGKPRQELTPEHLATLSRVIEAFPGARVTGFEKSSPAQEGGAA